MNALLGIGLGATMCYMVEKTVNLIKCCTFTIRKNAQCRGVLYLEGPPVSPVSQWCVQEEEPQRMLFESHEVAAAHLVRMLMRIFVDIEFTGDSMEFEAKFRESRTVALSRQTFPRV